MKTAQPIRDKRQVQKILSYYNHTGELCNRNNLLIATCLHTALRICDVLRLTWGDVFDFETGRVRTSMEIKEKKTGKSKIIALHYDVRLAIKKYKDTEQPTKATPLFINKRTNKAISRVQAYRIIHAAAKFVGIEGNVSCHSLRKTFGYHAWYSGVSPVVIMDIYNHSSFEVTRRYLGVTQDDKNKVYTGMDFGA